MVDSELGTMKPKSRTPKTNAAAQPQAPQAKPPKPTRKSKDTKAGIEQWWRKLPDLRAPYLADRWQRDVSMLIERGAKSVGEERTVALVA